MSGTEVTLLIVLCGGLALGLVWMGVVLYQKRRCSQAGWVGWSVVRASPSLLRRMKRDLALAAARLKDRPPTTAREARDTVWVLAALDQSGRWFAAQASHRNFRAAAKRVFETALGAPGKPDSGTVADIAARVELLGAAGEAEWAAARRIVLHTQGLLSVLPDPVHDCLTGWNLLDLPTRTAALAVCSDDGAAVPDALLERSLIGLREAGAASSADAALQEYGHVVLSLCTRGSAGQGLYRLGPRSSVILDESLKGQIITDQDLAAGLELCWGRHTAGVVLDADQRNSDYPPRDHLDRLLQLAAQYPDEVSFRQAAMVLAARRTPPFPDADAIAAAVCDWPHLVSPAAFVLQHRAGDPGLRFRALLALTRPGSDARVQRELAVTAVTLDADVPVSVVLSPAGIAALETEGLRDACLRYLARRFSGAAAETVPEQDRTAALQWLCDRSFAGDTRDGRALPTCLELIRAVLAHGLPTSAGAEALQPRLAGFLAGAAAWEGASPALDSLQSVALAVCRCGWSSPALLTWLAGRLAAEVDRLQTAEQFEHARSVFRAAVAHSLAVGAVGLIRLPASARGPLDPRVLVLAWNGGEQTDAVVTAYRELPLADTNAPIPPTEIPLALAAFERGLDNPNEFEYRLLRTLWRSEDMPAEQVVPLLERLLVRQAHDTSLLADFLRESPHAVCPALGLFALSELSKRGHATEEQQRRLARAMREGRWPSHLAPFASLVGDTRRTKAARAEDLVLAAECLGVEAVCAAGLAAALPDLLDGLQRANRDHAQRILQRPLVGELLLRLAAEADDAITLGLAAEALAAGQRWDEPARAVLQRAAVAGVLGAGPARYLAERLEQAGDTAGALGVLRQLAEHRWELDFVAAALERLAAAAGVTLQAYEWLDFGLLLAMREQRPRDELLRAGLAARVFQAPVVDPAVHRRVTAQLAAAGETLSHAALRAALETPGAREHTERLLTAAAGSAAQDGGLAMALQRVLAEHTFSSPEAERRLLCLLADQVPLTTPQVERLIDLSFALNQHSSVLAALFRRHEGALAESPPWSQPLVAAMAWCGRHEPESLSPRLQGRLAGEHGIHVGPAREATPAAQLSRQQELLIRAQQDPQGVPLVQLIELLEALLTGQDAAALGTYTELLCQRLQEEDAGQRGRETTVDVMLTLQRRGLLPRDGQRCLVQSLLDAERADPIVAMGDETLLDLRSPDLIRQAFRLLWRRGQYGVAALRLLLRAAAELGEAPFLGEVLTACESLVDPETCSPETEAVARVLEAAMCRGTPTPEQFRRGLQHMLRWPAHLFSMELELLLQAAEHDVLPCSLAACERLNEHCERLESQANRARYKHARLLRHRLRCLAAELLAADGVPQQTALQQLDRRNDLALIRLHGDVPETGRLLALIVTPLAGVAPASADLSLDRRLIEAAVRRLPDDAPWGEEELALADAVEPLGAREAVLAKASPSVAALVDRVLARTRALGEQCRFLAAVLAHQGRHPAAGGWFRDLCEKLEEGLYREQELPVGSLLEQDGWSAEQLARLFGIALQYDECPADPLLAAARRLGAVPARQAQVLMVRCLRRERREEAFALLAALAHGSGVASQVPAEPPVRIEFPEPAAARELFGSAVDDYLKEAEDDVRALLWKTDVSTAKQDWATAVVLACDLVRVARELPEAQGAGPERGLDLPALTAALFPRVRNLARMTYPDYVRVSVDGRLVSAVASWLDLECQPPQTLDRETIQRALRCVQDFDGVVVAELGDELTRRLYQQKYGVGRTVIGLFERWVPQQIAGLRDTACPATLDDWLTLVELHLKYGGKQEARQRFESILFQVLPKPAECGAALVRVITLALDVLKAFYREPRSRVKSWINKISDATRGFCQPSLPLLSGSARTAYARLMTWCGLSLIVDHAANPQTDLTFPKRWLREVRSEPQFGDEYHGRLIGQVLDAVSEDDFAAVLRLVASEDGLQELKDWTAEARSAPELEDTELFDHRFKFDRLLNDEQRQRRSPLRIMKDHQQQERLVVIKQIPPAVAQGIPADELQRMNREAETLRRMKHPGIVELLEGHLERPPYYLVMEYIPGKDLYEWIKAANPPPMRERLRVFKDLLDVIRQMHEQGCVHRSLHPRNVRVVDRAARRLSRVVVTDMASVKPFDATPAGRTTLLDNASEYMAPEVRTNPHAPATCAADVFSLGQLLAFLFANGDGRSPTSWPERLRPLHELFARATHLVPEERYGGTRPRAAGLTEMIDAFQEVLHTFDHLMVLEGNEGFEGLSLLNRYVGDVVLFRITRTSRILRGRLLSGGERPEVAVKVVGRKTDLGKELGNPHRLQRIEELRRHLDTLEGVVRLPRSPLELPSVICLFSEFVPPGISLAEIYENHRGPIHTATLLGWLDQCLEILAACHGRGILHRSLKPSNILVDERGQPRLSDFVFGVCDEGVLRRTSRVNCGDAYTAPEITRGIRASSEGADLFSLVLTFTVGLTRHRQPPVLSEHLERLRQAGRAERLTPLTDFLGAELAENPAQRRFTTTRDFQRALAGVVSRLDLGAVDPLPLVRETQRNLPEPRRVEPQDLSW